MPPQFFRDAWCAYAFHSARGRNIRDLRALMDAGRVIIGQPPFPAVLTAVGQWVNSTLN